MITRSLVGVAFVGAVCVSGCSSNVAPTSNVTPTANVATSPVVAPQKTPPIVAPKTVVPSRKTPVLKAIAWRKTLEAAQAEALKTRKPIMIDFYTDWCKICKIMDAEAYVDASVVEKTQKFVMVKVNAEQRTDLVLRFKITGYPTLIWLDTDGKILNISDRYYGIARLQDDMKTALRNFSTTG